MRGIKVKSKKTLALLLCAVMLVGLVPITAQAAVISGDGYSYDELSDTLTITSNDGFGVWRSKVNENSVMTVIIGDAVTYIPDGAFQWMNYLCTVIIGKEVASIGENAFYNSLYITKFYFKCVKIPTIGEGAFYNLPHMLTIFYPAGGKGYTSLGYTALSPCGEGTPVTGQIVLNFAKPMNTGVNGTVTLTPASGPAISLTTGGSWSGSTFTIPYSGLSCDTTYEVSTTGFKDGSNSDASLQQFSFTTVSADTPYLTAITTNNSGDSTIGNIVLTFNETMNKTAGTVSLDGGSTYLSGATWSEDGLICTIPYSGLSYYREYTVEITNFKDAAGNEMPFYGMYSFETTGDPAGYNCDLSYGSISLSSGNLMYYTDANTQTSVSYDTSKNIVIKQSNNGTTTSNTITVSGGTAKITLAGINISGGTPLSITSTSAVDVTVMNSNSLTGGSNCAGIFVQNNSSLHILAASTGSLIANGSGYAAGIGGQGKLSGDIADCHSGTIIISGGTVTATGGEIEGAGIGSSEYNYVGDITIDGGTVTANGGGNGSLGGAGIGGAYDGAVFATANYNIIIRGNAHVTANAGDASSGIGSGRLGRANSGIITIEGTPTVTANGHSFGAAIGGGEQTTGGTVNISGGTVNAYAHIVDGRGGAGIGGGTHASGGVINISGGNITARGSLEGAAIGGGNDGNGGQISISGGTVTVPEPNFQAAGIGGGYSGSGGTIDISGGVVNVCNHSWGAGIGGGDGGAAGTVTISGGFVTAGSSSGAGIGCGKNGSGGTVTIEAGSVNANSVSPAPTNDGTTAVYMSTITGLPANTLLNYEIDHYMDTDDNGSFKGGLSCISDSSGKNYLWLPLNEAKHTTVVAKDTTVTEGGPDNAYYAASGYVTTGTNNFTESTKSPSYTRASASALPETYTMNVNQTHTFYAVAENCAYRGAVWTSSNPAVAIVSQDGDGVVTTIGGGETTISATSYDGGFTGSFVLRVDTTAPSGYTVSINDSDGVYINKADVTANSDLSFTISGAEVGSTLNYTVNRSTYSFNSHTSQWEESSPVLYKSDSIAITSTMQSVSIGTLATDGSTDGKYMLSVTLTDTAGNTSTPMTDAIIVDTTPTSGDILYFNNGNNIAYSENADKVLTYWHDTDIYWEYNAVFKYTLTSKTGGSPVSGSIAMNEENLIPPASHFCFYIDMSALPDGDFDFVYSFTDPAGNKSADYTYTYHKDVSLPTCDLSFGQSVINSTNQTVASFTLDNISEALRYNYTISDGTNSVGKSTYKYYDPTTETTSGISNIDLSSLSDGMLTLTVKMYDSHTNLNFYTATIIKDTIAPTVTLPAVSTTPASIGLNFNETVTAVEGKTVAVSDGTDTYTCTIASEDNYLSGEGSGCTAAIPLTAFINGSNTLTFDSTKTYTVTVEAGAYKDDAGNDLAASSLSLNLVTVVNAVISPASRNYDLSAPADVTTAITWNSATAVTGVVYGDYTLTGDTEFTLAGDNLAIMDSYLSSLSLTTGAALEFNINFNIGAASTLTVNVVNGYTPSDDADLSSLSVNGLSVNGFDPGDTEYDVELPYGAASATVSATANDSNAQVSITQASSLPGSAVVTVTAEDGSTTRTYTVNLTIAAPPATYTISFSSNGSIYATKTVNAGQSIGSVNWPSNPARRRYTFGGWFTGENGAGTQFTSATPVNATATVYIKWTYSGGGGTPSATEYKADVNTGNGSETTLPVTVNKDTGTALIDVSSQSLAQDGTVITIPSIPDVDAYSVDIPVSELLTTGEQGTMTVNTDIGSITVPSNMLTGVEGISGSKAQISIGQGDKSTLPADVKAAIGSRPIIQLTLSIDGKQINWSNPNAAVTVSIPYTPTADELKNPESIVVWYNDGSGNAVSVPNGHYDSAAGTVTFDVTHFSYYAVTYNIVSFNDVAKDAWYNKAVSFIAARGITSGTGSGNYSPDARLTRGEFLVMLMKAYSISPDTNSADNFSDAGNTYYTGYLAAAKRLGISEGIGNNMFAPANQISRQEMFTLLHNVLKLIGQPRTHGRAVDEVNDQPRTHGRAVDEVNDQPRGNSGKTLSDFTDAGQIDAWAKEAMTLMVETGIVGGSNGALNPAGATTRAEMAQVLYKLLAK